MTAAAQSTGPEPATIDAKPVGVDYKPTAPPPSTIMPKTVDYGHGHGKKTAIAQYPLHSNVLFQTRVGDIRTLVILEPGATVERISYGERIVLRPDPVPHDRAYEKGELIKIMKRLLKKNSSFIKQTVISLRTSWWQRPLQQRLVL